MVGTYFEKRDAYIARTTHMTAVFWGYERHFTTFLLSIGLLHTHCTLLSVSGKCTLILVRHQA